MKIRPLHPADIQQVLLVEEAAQIVPWSEIVFTKCLEAGYSGWVIEFAERIAGFIILSVTVGEAHILNVCVHPQFQRQGLGRQLMNHGLHEASRRGASLVYLEVRRSNTRAIDLYQKLGFQPIGERKGYYPDPHGPEDALVFAKDLGIIVSEG